MRSKRFGLAAALLFGFLGLAGEQLNAQAQFPLMSQGRFCRPSSTTGLEGTWQAELSITGLGTTQSLMSLSQGGGLIETDAIDLVDPNVVHSPGYGAVKAIDCTHFAVTIVKYLYTFSSKQALTTTLHGSVVSNDDGKTWSGQLNQEFVDANGNVVSTDTVNVSAKRILASMAK